MKTKNAVSIILALAVCVITTGCPKRIVVTLYNNTDYDCRISLYGKSKTLNSRAKINFDYPLVDAELGIQCGRTNFSYRMPRAPKSLLKTRPFAQAVSLQFEPDGTIYVVIPSDRFPAKLLVDQPEGFPLRPTNRVVLE